MAEAATAAATFKLVLVGDGGTGKVRRYLEYTPISAVVQSDRIRPGIPCIHLSLDRLLTSMPDHFRQASLDWRIRKEIHRHPWCGSPPSSVCNGRQTEFIMIEGKD